MTCVCLRQYYGQFGVVFLQIDDQNNNKVDKSTKSQDNRCSMMFYFMVLAGYSSEIEHQGQFEVICFMTRLKYVQICLWLM